MDMTKAVADPGGSLGLDKPPLHIPSLCKTAVYTQGDSDVISSYQLFSAIVLR